MEQLWGWWLKQCSLRLVLVAPRRVALGTPMGLLLAAVGPVTGTVTPWAEGDRGAGPCALPVPFALTPHNNFNQLLQIEVWGHRGIWGHWGMSSGVRGLGTPPWHTGMCAPLGPLLPCHPCHLTSSSPELPCPQSSPHVPITQTPPAVFPCPL